MKKIFLLMAMAAMAMACDSEVKPTPGNGGVEDDGDDVVTAIQIDGKYSDWDGLEGVQVATLPKGDVEYEQLKTFKVYADETFIYVFCEFDPENTLVFVPYFDLDNDPSTGNDSKWNGAGYEAKAEGDVFEEVETDDGPVQGAPKAWDPSFYMYTDSGTEKVCASGIGAVMSSVPAQYNGGSTWAFEAAIVRELIAGPYNLGSEVTFGMIQYDLDWQYIGKLPCKTWDDRDAGQLETMLTVTLP